MSRETKTFTTPLGHTIVLNAYLTGREANEIKAIMFGSMKADMNDVQSGRIGFGDISGSVIIEQEKKTVAFLLVAVDGNSEKPLEALENLPASEYAAVKAEIDKLTNPTTPVK